MSARASGAHGWPRPLVFVGIAAVCAGGIAFVRALAREGTPAGLATATLAAQGALSLGCAWLARLSSRAAEIARTAALVAIGLGTVGVGIFFGPSSGLAALVALLLVLAGVLTGDGPGRYPPVAGWLAYGALAASQALAFALVALGAIPDAGLSPVIAGDHPMWHHVVGQGSLQLVYLAAFLAGQAFERRYRVLAWKVDETMRAVARRDALLEEARAEYKLALAAGRQGLFSGQTLGDYQLGDVLARGGMGEVYGAVRTDGAPVAVKLLRPDHLADGAHVERFLHEAEVARRVDSPYVARVLATGGLEEQMPFIAMERLDGETLAAIARAGPLGRDEVSALVAHVSGALEAIHAAGVLHLDVSPANIVRTAGPDGAPVWKLVDFGVAQLAGHGAGGPAAGVLRYLAPERLGGSFVDERADVYGLCASIHLALRGREPFDDVAPHDLAGAVASRAPAPLGDPAIDRVIARGMAKDPADRFAGAAELRDALLAAIAGGPRPAPARRPTAPQRVPTTPRASSTAERAPTSTMGESIASSAWRDAYLAKMRGAYLGVTAACLFGAVVFAVLAEARTPLYVAWGCFAAIIACAWLDRLLIRRHGDPSVYWPWAVAGALTAGPAYSLGLHSGFTSVITVLLFAGGLYRASMRASWTDRRGLAFAAICVAHTALLVLVLARVLPDDGNLPIREPGTPIWEPIIKHLALLVVYTGAFFAGGVVDRSYQALTSRAEAAAREAAAREALLVTARAEIDRALAGAGGGLFTDTHVAGYRVGRLLGRGGMGEVYEASDLETGERVAIKLLRRERLGDAHALRRFTVEASALARAHSPYVAAVRRVSGPGDDLAFIAMEYIDGVSLSAMLRGRERLELPLVRSVINDIGRGLQDIHRAGVLHRDVKPQNILHTTEAAGHIWKLVDFGAAKLVDPSAATTQHVIIGTPRYMAPEQATGRADPRSDLYSLCLVAYRALTGRPAFTGTDPVAIARAAVEHGPPDPRAFVELSPDLTLCLRLGLAARPDDRFATASELLAAFDGAFDGRLDPRVRSRALALMARAPWS